jgi:hypothetical protein
MEEILRRRSAKKDRICRPWRPVKALIMNSRSAARNRP